MKSNFDSVIKDLTKDINKQLNKELNSQLNKEISIDYGSNLNIYTKLADIETLCRSIYAKVSSIQRDSKPDYYTFYHTK